MRIIPTILMEIVNFLERNNLTYPHDINSELNKAPYFITARWNNNKVYCLNYTPGKSRVNDVLVREANGIILTQRENKIVCYGIDVFEEMGIELNSDIMKKIETNIAKVHEIPDGSFIKLYYFDNKWILATTKIADAKDAYWYGCPNFHDMFMEILHDKYPGLLNDLNKQYTYVFLMQHPHNRIVNDSKEPMIYHISTTDLNGLNEIDVDIGIPKLVERESKDIKKLIENMDWRTAGLFISWRVSEDGKPSRIRRIKIENPKFTHVLSLRGNHPNLKYRYLELKKKDANVLQEVYNYYPEFREKFETYDAEIMNLINTIHDIYMDLYVHHKISHVEQHNYKNFLRLLHDIYLRTRVNTTVDEIFKTFRTLHVEQQALIMGITNQVMPRQKIRNIQPETIGNAYF